MSERTLGIDLACRAAHQASLADEKGKFVWAGRRFRSVRAELEAVLAAAGGPDGLTVVMEPTRNAWAPVAAFFRAQGASVVLVPPERAADLRKYFSKHAKTDKLDSKMLARLPGLHPEGVAGHDAAGPTDDLRRAVRRRANLVKDRVTVHQRLDALLELFGPGYAEALGAGDYSKTALAVLAGFGNPRALLRFGRERLTSLLVKSSQGAWREDKADDLLLAARAAVDLWADGGIDFAGVADDITSEVRMAQLLDTEIARIDERIEALYAKADPAGIVISAPGLGVTLAAGILGRLGDARRFASLAGVRGFSGMVPGTDQSGTRQGRPGLTKAGDPGLRRDLYLAADLARHIDPVLAGKYHDLMVKKGKCHTSAVCHVATALLTRIGSCLRRGEPYVLRDTDGNDITAEEGRHIVKERFTVPAEVRVARRRTRLAQTQKQGTGRRREGSRSAPAASPSPTNAIGQDHAA